ncbi:MAG TPA: chloramphenicol phosphotransferase CPT family protein [Candidatus Aquabacterium excrementipullorum]|nr:chloramphenicol phosphotransferase CPT family protein [Candidatus Aquabacterium excrementipullorum]
MPPLHRSALPEPARVVVLHGTSSAGKTSLAKAMQACWASPLHHVQADVFRAMEPPAYWDRWDTREKPTIDLMLDALCGAVHAAVDAYAKHGQEVVLDTVITNPRARQLLAEDLAHLPVYLIGVRCDPAETVRREAARGNRAVGLAASQFDWIHKRMQYDIEVDTTGKSPEKVAADISHWLTTGPVPTALQRLRA